MGRCYIERIDEMAVLLGCGVHGCDGRGVYWVCVCVISSDEVVGAVEGEKVRWSVG